MGTDIFGAADFNTLAARMKGGDRKAAATIYDKLFPKAYGFILARTSNEEASEDLAQEIFIKLIEKVNSFDDKRGSFTVWFWRIVQNSLIDYYRIKRPVPFSSFDERTVESMAVSRGPDDIDERLRYLRLIDLVKTLSEEEREMFELRFIAEMSYKDIAELTDRSEGSLRIAAMRLKEKIRNEFKDEI